MNFFSLQITGPDYILETSTKAVLNRKNRENFENKIKNKYT